MKYNWKIGYLFEVDLNILNNDNYNGHSDLTYCPENVINDSQLPKLFTTLYDEQKYVLHYLNLKRALKAKFLEFLLIFI